MFTSTPVRRSILLTLACILSWQSARISKADILITVEDAILARDGTALVRVTALDEGPTPSAISSFTIALQIQDTATPDRQIQFLDDGAILQARQQADYVFAGKTPFLQEQEISSDGIILTVTDAIHFLETASLLGTRKLITEFNVGLDLSQELAAIDSLSIEILATSELFDQSGFQIAPSRIAFVDGPVQIVAVPEPGGVALIPILASLRQFRRRRYRA